MAKRFTEQVREWKRDLDRKAREMHNPPSQQTPQFPEDQHGPRYSNDVARDWRRGFGKNGRESAEGKPNFDRRKA